MDTPEIWPEYIGALDDSGFSDYQLELLCAESPNTSDRGFKAPWMFFSSEVYGAGESFRRLTGWPRWLPIPVASDHGVALRKQLEPHEEENFSRTHLTWSKWRTKADTSKNVVRVLHPLVAFRRMAGVEKRSGARGTLAFIPHTTLVDDYAPYDWKKYFGQIEKLPLGLRPRAICIHKTDVRKGLHVFLRQFGLPIFSVGNGSNQNYAARFYDLISRFENATSSSVGSQLWYCEELGVRYFLYGEEPVSITDSVLVGDREGVDQKKSMLSELYSEIPPRSSSAKQAEIEAALFTSQTVAECRALLRHIFAREIVLVLPGLLAKLFQILGSTQKRKKLKQWVTLQYVE